MGLAMSGERIATGARCDHPRQIGEFETQKHVDASTLRQVASVLKWGSGAVRDLPATLAIRRMVKVWNLSADSADFVELDLC